MPGESILYVTKVHPFVFMEPAMFFGIYLLFLGFLSVVFWNAFADLLGIFALVLIFVIARVLYGVVKALIIFTTTECALTDHRVIGKYGLINRQSLEIVLTKVEAIHVRQPIFGRIFDYGTVVVIGTGGSKNPFLGIASPMKFRKRVQERIASA